MKGIRLSNARPSPAEVAPENAAVPASKPSGDSGGEPLAQPRTKTPRVWAVGGGKGGIGKSLLTANLGITMAQLGRRVLVIDVDLGGANLHSCLGVTQPAKSLDAFVHQESDLAELAVKTPVANLELISGANDFVGAANPKHQQKVRLIRKIGSLDYDIVILDLGAGTAYNTLDFFLAAEQGLLLSLPEPTSIENLYRFIKAAFYRRMRDLESHFRVRELVTAAMKQDQGIRSPQQLFEQIKKMEPERGQALQEAMQRFRPKLVINQVRSGADAAVGQQVGLAVRKYFGIDLQYVGYLEYDDAVWRAVRRRRPLLIEYPGSRLAGSFRTIGTKLLEA